MGRYILRRTLSAIPVLFLVTLIAFFLMKLVPGDPATVIAGMDATAEELAAIRSQLGLDRPLLVQLGNWYLALAQGDLGDSYLLGRSVTAAIIERLPVTLSIAILALLLTVVIAIISGVVAALRQNTWVDQALMSFALLGVSIPNFWLGLLLIILFAVQLGLLPSGGYVPLSENPWGWIKSMLLPSLSLALAQMGLLARMTRSTMLEVLRQDYIRTAQAKGLTRFQVIAKHALKNVMIPVVTVVGIIFSLLLGGSIVIETIYSVPGVGRLIGSAIMRRDYPVIQGGLLFIAGMLVVVNLIVDVLYAYFDPRVRYDR